MSISISYLESILSPTNPDKPYVFSIGGWTDSHGGHSHFWNAGTEPGSFHHWICYLHLHHGGSLPPVVGNYECLRLEYSYDLFKYYRTVFNQEGDTIFTLDPDSHIRKLHLLIYDTWLAEWLLGFAVDSGDYISTPDNSEQYKLLGRKPKYHYFPGPGRTVCAAPYVSSCTLPQREHALQPWFSSSGGTHDMITGYTIGTGFGGVAMDHSVMLQNAAGRLIQQSVYMDQMGESVGVSNPLRYTQEKVHQPWTTVFDSNDGGSTDNLEGKAFFEVHVEESDIWPDDPGFEYPYGGSYSFNPNSVWVKSLIGTKLIPYFRITYRDLNGNIKTYLPTEVELYGEPTITTSPLAPTA